MPLSVLVNAMMARHLGPRNSCILPRRDYSSFGSCSWIGARAPRSRRWSPRIGPTAELLGTGLAFRALMSVSFALLQLSAWLLGYGLDFRRASVVWCARWSDGHARLPRYGRGFERTDVAALGQIGAQVLGAAFSCRRCCSAVASRPR